ncbi:MAG: hypothetical protein ABIW83_02370 [Allosphingosinicella sp.]
MITLLWTAVIAASAPAVITDPDRRDAVHRCKPALARKVKGDVENVTVVQFRKTGREILLNGAMSALQRPLAKPGELATHHVLNIRYSYECRFSARAAPRVKVARLPN